MTTTKATLNSMDQILVKGLKSNDPKVQQTCVLRLFYKECRCLINAIRFDLFKGNVEYDDIVNELYLLLSAYDWRALDSFRGDAKLTTWLSCVVWRYFIKVYVRKERESAVDDMSFMKTAVSDTISDTEIMMDVESVLRVMPNRRYAEAISLHIVEGMGAEETAVMLGTSVENFYNLKLRALRQFISLYKQVKISRNVNI